MEQRDFSRREFIRLSALAGAGLALSGADALGAEDDLIKKNIQTDCMSYAVIGRTKMLVSRLSVGAVPWNGSVARAAIERGCNLVHGAGGYRQGKGMIEQGKTLKGLWDKVFFMLKGNPNEKEVDKALKALGTDHVDMVVPVFAKAQGLDNPRIQEDFQRLKKAGKVHFLGFTVHSKEPLEQVVDAGVKAGFYDAVLTMYQVSRKEPLIPVLKRARAAGMGTFSMKTLQGVKGSDEELAKVIEAALAKGEIDSVLKAIKNVEQLDVFAKAAQRQKSASLTPPIPDEEIVQMADRSVCGACGACAKVCRGGLDLPEIMRCATYYGPELDEYARETYREIPRRLTALSCKDCGQCEEACPRGLPIRKLIRQAHQRWGVA